MTLVNVRLEPEDALRVKALRDAGVQLSTLVRDAIHAEYDRRIRPAGTRKPSEVLADILAALPDSDSGPRIDTTDRRAVKKHIAAKLRRS